MPLESPMEGLTQLASEGDACIVDFANAELSAAMENITVAGGGKHSGTRLFGRAGSLLNTSEVEAVEERKDYPAVEAPSWKTFGKAYARGMFDPQKIPNPPAESGPSERDIASTPSSPGRSFSRLGKMSMPPSIGSSSSQGNSSTSGSSTSLSSAPSTIASSNPPSTSGSRSMAAAMNRRETFELDDPPPPPRPDKLAIPSYSLAAATVRMATTGQRSSDFSPLAIPSPERELNDPLASFTHGSSSLRNTPNSDPGSARMGISRSYSNITEKMSIPPSYLPTIAGSPATTPLEHPDDRSSLSRQPSLDRSRTSPLGRSSARGGIINTRIPPASAPLEKTIEAEATTDYFGTISPPHFERQASHQSGGSSATVTAEGTPMIRTRTPDHSTLKTDPDAYVPPLLAEPADLGELYHKLGWLPAPLPPNEEARRRALYRFNILHSAPDVNFDRIAHMAKLVFSTKIVAIALIDGSKQWYKVSSGMGDIESVDRLPSLCAHTLLTP
jgi:hypothetical protein